MGDAMTMIHHDPRNSHATTSPVGHGQDVELQSLEEELKALDAEAVGDSLCQTLPKNKYWKDLPINIYYGKVTIYYAKIY